MVSVCAKMAIASTYVPLGTCGMSPAARTDIRERVAGSASAAGSRPCADAVERAIEDLGREPGLVLVFPAGDADPDAVAAEAQETAAGVHVAGMTGTAAIGSRRPCRHRLLGDRILGFPANGSRRFGERRPTHCRARGDGEGRGDDRRSSARDRAAVRRLGGRRPGGDRRRRVRRRRRNDSTRGWGGGRRRAGALRRRTRAVRTESSPSRSAAARRSASGSRTAAFRAELPRS